MPRLVDPYQELKKVELLSPDATVQYTSKIPVPTVIELLHDCVSSNTPPSTRIHEVLAEYFQYYKFGLQFQVEGETRKALDTVARHLNVTRETAAKLAIERAIHGMVEEILAEHTRLKENLNEIESGKSADKKGK